MGSWQFTLGQALLFMTVLSLFCYFVAWRSGFGVLVLGGVTGLGLVIAGKRCQNGIFFAAGLFMDSVDPRGMVCWLRFPIARVRTPDTALHDSHC